MDNQNALQNIQDYLACTGLKTERLAKRMKLSHEMLQSCLKKDDETTVAFVKEMAKAVGETEEFFLSDACRAYIEKEWFQTVASGAFYETDEEYKMKYIAELKNDINRIESQIQQLQSLKETKIKEIQEAEKW